MKTNSIFAAFLLAAVCMAPQAQADVLAWDNFDYADGNLVPNGGWENYSGASDLLVETSQAIIRHSAATEDAKLSFTGVAGKVYYGFNFSVDDLGQPFSMASTDFEYFATFHDGSASNNLSARMDIVAPSGTGDFSVGIASDEGTADATWGTDLTFGTTYRAVVSFDQSADLAQLWLDPVLESDLSILGEDRPDPGDTVLAFALRQTGSDEGETIRVDNLVVGTSFSDVVTGVPEPGSMAILSLGLLGLVSRRNRR